MTKPKISTPVILTLVFAAFLLGLFLGRTGQSCPVTVAVSPEVQAQPIPPMPDGVDASAAAVRITFPIDINRADADAFMALPGIDYVLAKRMIAYRNEIGAFTRVEDLLNVKGIGNKRMEEIYDLITIGG